MRREAQVTEVGPHSVKITDSEGQVHFYPVGRIGYPPGATVGQQGHVQYRASGTLAMWWFTPLPRASENDDA